MPKWYDRWMFDWETRLTAVDSNRVVRTLEWGIDWTNAWPCRYGVHPGEMPANPEAYLRAYNDRIIEKQATNSSPTAPYSKDFRLEETPGPSLQHPRQARAQARKESSRPARSIFALYPRQSPAPYPENNLANARWFPRSRQARRRSVSTPIGMPTASNTTRSVRILNKVGTAALRMSLPYHDIRKPRRNSAFRIMRVSVQPGPDA